MSNTTTPGLRIGLVGNSRYSLQILVISSLWVIAFLSGCVTIKSVDQPTYAQAGHIICSSQSIHPFPGELGHQHCSNKQQSGHGCDQI
jgi:hypothetical protein